jgi:hypothetical protein
MHIYSFKNKEKRKQIKKKSSRINPSYKAKSATIISSITTTSNYATTISDL